MRQIFPFFVTASIACALIPSVSNGQSCSPPEFTAKKEAALNLLRTSSLALDKHISDLYREKLISNLVVEQLPAASAQGGAEGIFTKVGSKQVIQVACPGETEQTACALGHEMTHAIFDDHFQDLGNSREGLNEFKSLGAGFRLGTDIVKRKIALTSLTAFQKEALLDATAYTVCNEYGAYQVTFACMRKDFDLDDVAKLLNSSYLAHIYGIPISTALMTGIIATCEKNTELVSGSKSWGRVNATKFFSEISKNRDLKSQFSVDIDQQIRANAPTRYLVKVDCAIKIAGYGAEKVVLASRGDFSVLNQKTGGISSAMNSGLLSGTEIFFHAINDPTNCGPTQGPSSFVNDTTIVYDSMSVVPGEENALHYFFVGYRK